MVKPWLVIALVGCGNERDVQREPPPAQSEGRSFESSGSDGQRGTAAAVRRSIDLRVEGAPVSIRGVELVPSSRERGVVELGYRAEAKAPSLQVPAQIMCRVGGFNIVYPASGDGKVSGPRLATLFRPDPFSEPVEACEVAFFVDRTQIATACFRDGALADGACPPGTFPPPPLRTTFAVELTRPALELRHGTALVSGLFTLARPLDEGRRFATQIRCQDDAGVATGEGELAFLPLDSIPVGASVYGPVAMFLDRTPSLDATCELRVVSRALAGLPTEQVHARYCLTTGAVRAGACP
jgi:hypothetical protein